MKNYYLRNTIIVKKNDTPSQNEEENTGYGNGGAEGGNTGNGEGSGTGGNNYNTGVVYNPNVFNNIQNEKFRFDPTAIIDAARNGLMPQGNFGLIKSRRAQIVSNGWYSWDNGLNWFFLHNGKYYSKDELYAIMVDDTKEPSMYNNWVFEAIELHPCKQSGNCQSIKGWSDIIAIKKRRRVINGKVVYAEV